MKHYSKIWNLAHGGAAETSLDQAQWFTAMKLVALAQETGQISLFALFGDNPSKCYFFLSHTFQSKTQFFCTDELKRRDDVTKFWTIGFC